MALAMACFALAQALGGSGFIAAFAGGLLFGWLAKEHKHGLLAAEETGETRALLTWVVFGAGVCTDDELFMGGLVRAAWPASCSS